MTWCHVMVWRGPPEDASYTLVEVHLDESECITNWANIVATPAAGVDADDLRADLVAMMLDALRWKPIPFTKLRVGLKLERAIPRGRARLLQSRLKALVREFAADEVDA